MIFQSRQPQKWWPEFDSIEDRPLEARTPQKHFFIVPEDDILGEEHDKEKEEKGEGGSGRRWDTAQKSEGERWWVT